MTLLFIIISLLILFLGYQAIKYYINRNRNLESNTEQQNILNEYSNNENNNHGKLTELSEEDKIEMSWGFLYRITDIIKKQFNKDEKNQLYEIGKKLLEYGMQYNHSVKDWYSAHKNNAKKKMKSDVKSNDNDIK